MQRFASRLTVVHVVDLSVATMCDPAVAGIPIDTMRKQGATNVQNVLNHLSADGVHALGRSLEAHNPAAEVVRLTDELEANLLVIGTHMRTGIQKMILGSFAEGAIHHAHCPVLTIGPKVKVRPEENIPFRTIVFATDLHHSSVEKAAVALAFAKDSLAQVYMCHVLTHPPSHLIDSLDLQFTSERELSKLIPAAAYEWCSPECTIEYGNAAAHIVKLAEKAGADLIVLGAHRDVAWFTHLSEGTVARVISEANCPVMTVCAA